MNCLKINVLSLNKVIKDILLHSGFFLVQDIIEFHNDNFTNIPTEPKLTNEQIEVLKYEIDKLLCV